MTAWYPVLAETDRPKYLRLVDAIDDGIKSGALKPGDRLPPQRKIAALTGLDFSTVSRGYSEAIRQGLVESFVGRGTFVSARKPDGAAPDPRRALEEDPMMNMPPEPDDPALLEKMRQGLGSVAASLVPVLRYQSVMGSALDREIGHAWAASRGVQMPLDRLAITPGAHASLFAILLTLRTTETTVLSEAVTYPGIRSICARLGVPMVGLAGDADGIFPDHLEDQIKANPGAVLYLNPTLQNPTTHTIPKSRRADIAEILKRHRTPLIEDDAYIFVASDAPAPISSLVPDLAWHVLGLSKCFGAGLRLAYTTLPNREREASFSHALSSLAVMTSPLSIAILAEWIESGTADELLSFVRRETSARQAIASDTLDGLDFAAHPEAFNTWLKLPEGVSPSQVLAQMTGRQIGVVPSDAFTVSAPAQAALRVCLGGSIGREKLREDLGMLVDVIRGQNWAG